MKLTSAILIGILSLPAPVWAQEAAPPEHKLSSPGLAPGDQILIRMYDFPDIGSTGVSTHISADGTVHLPYAGTVQVMGLSPSEAERAIGDSLQSKGIVKDPNVTLDVVSSIGLSVTVLGQVINPRAIPVYAPVPVSFVMSQVGGLTGYAQHRLTILHHSEEPPTSVDYDPDAISSASLTTLVQPGDVVTVSSRGVYFIAGEVLRPGIFPLGGAVSIGAPSATSGLGVVKNLTLLEALAQAGGITAIAARSKMRIIRTVDGKREEILVDQVKLYKGEIADPIIHADDIIYVPSSYVRQQTNNLFGTAISALYASIQIRQLN